MWPFLRFLKKSPDRVKATPSRGKPHKGNPPYPPLSGGQEKTTPHQTGKSNAPPPGGEDIAFLYPPVKRLLKNSRRVGPNTPPLRGLLKKSQESILGCVHAFEFHSPLEGESKRPSGLREGRFGGGSFSVACPPTNSPAGFALVSLSGFPLGKPDPQGGSELLSRRTRTYNKSKNRNFINNPDKGGRGGCFSSQGGRPLYSLKEAFSTIPSRSRSTRHHPKSIPSLLSFSSE